MIQDLHPWGYCLTLHTASYSAPKLHDIALTECLIEGPLGVVLREDRHQAVEKNEDAGR